MLQVALWLVLKTADSKKQLVLPLSIFGLHLFLGNWWNGERFSNTLGNTAAGPMLVVEQHAAHI